MLTPFLSACELRQGAGAGAAAAAAAATVSRCLPGERGYLRMSLRGAINAEIDARGSSLGCEGGERPDGRGLRLSFAVPALAGVPALRIVFGLDAAPRRNATGPLPTNLTLIAEGKQRLYATQGEEHCSIEGLDQQAVGTAGEYRVAARGSCIDPATTLDGAERLYVNRFDFAGLASFAPEEPGHVAAN